ncbi:unnamed protein product [Musa hybrid cultivar]
MLLDKFHGRNISDDSWFCNQNGNCLQVSPHSSITLNCMQFNFTATIFPTSPGSQPEWKLPPSIKYNFQLHFITRCSICFWLNSMAVIFLITPGLSNYELMFMRIILPCFPFHEAHNFSIGHCKKFLFSPQSRQSSMFLISQVTGIDN